MIARTKSSAPQSPTQARRARPEASPPPAADGVSTESWEVFWSIIAGMFGGLLIGGLLIALFWQIAVDLAVKVLMS